MKPIPPYEKMMNPVILALRELGGSGTIEEIEDEVIDSMEFTEEQLSVVHNPDKGGQSKISYRLAWARTYLKKFGILENSSRGVWALTLKGRETEFVDEDEVRKFVRAQSKKNRLKTENRKANQENDLLDEEEVAPSWRDELLSVIQKMDPAAFERLAQRLLRESGFIQVEVTGKSGDGGIDGKGIMRLGGLLSFHVIFQCKRYVGSVGSSHVRDFRGAMVGRADKGLFITTGKFTREAEKEATRDGAPAIDLIDGELLIDKLKELNLGVSTKVVEQVEINADWFNGL